MFESIEQKCRELSQQFDLIPSERKAILAKISTYIQAKKDAKHAVNLVYICTHNSRRSHFGQIWAAVAAAYYNLQEIHSYSGGTEATRFNQNAIKALKSTGFIIQESESGVNPVFQVHYSETENCTCFSKCYDDSANPQENFAAIMTCSDAEENCPFIAGAELRIATKYDDPKAFDGTDLETEKYLERSEQIARETLYIFSLIK